MAQVRLGGREVYRNPWMSVREDRIRREDGSEGIYGVVDKPDFALVVPVADDGGLWLVEQFRYPVQRRSWEFPQGSWPAGASGTPEELAAAELAEETGLRADAMAHLGRIDTASGFCNQACDVFVATGLRPGPSAREATEADMVQRLVPVAEFERMVAAGEVTDGATLAAWLLHLTRGRHL